MIVVGIETSGTHGSVAVVRDDDCLAERTLSTTGRRHARTLVMELRELLESVEIRPQDVEVVAVSIGPGSFTGLRVGLVCGKTMAYAIGAKLVAVDSFEAVARNAPPDVMSLTVIGDAQRGDVFVGEYQRLPEGRWERGRDIRIVEFAVWNADLPSDAVVSGPGLESYRDDLELHERALGPEYCRPRATHVAHIGAELSGAGVSHDPYSIDPIYGRKSSAEEKLESHSD